MSDFEIILPEQKIDEEEQERRNRAMFSEDKLKGGLLSKTLIFTKLNQPVSTTEITEILNKYYTLDYDRATIYRILQKLIEKYIIATTTTGVIMQMSEMERNEIHKQIAKKHYEFIQRIPEQFRKKFQNVNYFWVSNGIGTKYIKWCCDLLNFKYREKQK